MNQLLQLAALQAHFGQPCLGHGQAGVGRQHLVLGFFGRSLGLLGLGIGLGGLLGQHFLHGLHFVPGQYATGQTGGRQQQR